VILYKKIDLAQKQLFEDLVFYIAKGYYPLNYTQNVWLRRLVHHQCSRVVFPNKQQFINDIIPNMVCKTMECHVIPTHLLKPPQLQPHLIYGCPEQD
jgi:hypothetical protein